jgi:hypothetical protein
LGHSENLKSCKKKNTTKTTDHFFDIFFFISLGNNSVLLCFLVFLFALMALALDSSAGQPDFGAEHASQLQHTSKLNPHFKVLL